MVREILKQGFNEAEIACPDETLDKLVLLVDLLADWNQRLNLTAVRDKSEMARLHILDSAVISPLLADNAVQEIADVGTGAGFPGLVLAALNPDKRFTLIDSIAKKLSFVRMAAVKLNLANVEILNKRVEEIRDRSFDAVVSRAFAPLGKMCRLCSLILKPEGFFLAMKANLSEDEYKDVPQSVKIIKTADLKVPGLPAKRQAVFLKLQSVNRG